MERYQEILVKAKEMEKEKERLAREIYEEAKGPDSSFKTIVFGQRYVDEIVRPFEKGLLEAKKEGREHEYEVEFCKDFPFKETSIAKEIKKNKPSQIVLISEEMGLIHIRDVFRRIINVKEIDLDMIGVRKHYRSYSDYENTKNKILPVLEGVRFVRFMGGPCVSCSSHHNFIVNDATEEIVKTDVVVEIQRWTCTVNTTEVLVFTPIKNFKIS